MTPLIKICGIKTQDALHAAVKHGATHVGFNFYRKSPRYLTPREALILSASAPNIISVALTVDASDTELDVIVAEAKPQSLQLHGNETMERIAHIKSRYQLPVIKAFSVENAHDVEEAKQFEQAADILLFDAKPGALPGGNGESFDWSLIANHNAVKPWFLSGGLTPANVARAISETKTGGVDVSSGVEKSRGEKDPNLIKAFIEEAKRAFSAKTNK